MNYIQSKAIADLYKELISLVPKDKLNMPKHYRIKFDASDISDIYLEDDQVVAKFSRYAGCNEYDTETTYTNLEDLFE